MLRLFLTDPEKRIKKPEKRAVQTVHCVLVALTCCTAELPLSVSILSATCASTSPRSSGRELKWIWPKNAVFFRSCCAKSTELCFVFWWRRAIESDRLSALSLSPSLSIFICTSLAFGILSIPKKRYVEHANVTGQRQVRDAGASLTSFVVVGRWHNFT